MFHFSMTPPSDFEIAVVVLALLFTVVCLLVGAWKLFGPDPLDRWQG